MGAGGGDLTDRDGDFRRCCEASLTVEAREIVP